MSDQLSDQAHKLLCELYQHFLAHRFTECAPLARALIDHGVAIEFKADMGFQCRFAEWTPGKTEFRGGTRTAVTFHAWTKPTPARKIGNHWSGGTASSLGEAAPFSCSRQIPAEDFRAFTTAIMAGTGATVG